MLDQQVRILLFIHYRDELEARHKFREPITPATPVDGKSIRSDGIQLRIVPEIAPQKLLRNFLKCQNEANQAIR